MANSEDLNRLTSCSLVLLGHIFLSLGNSRESMNMVTPAMQLASKIPDVHVQLWATAILKGMYYIYSHMYTIVRIYFRRHTRTSKFLLQICTEFAEIRIAKARRTKCIAPFRRRY